MRKQLRIFSLGIFLILGGCPTSTPPVPVKSQAFLHPGSFTEYHSSGRILLKTGADKQSGEMSLSLSSELDVRLQIFAPLIGSLLYEVRTTPQEFMVLDFRDDQYLLDQNNRWTRENWLGTNLKLEELSWIVWGRIPKHRFEEGNGQFVHPNQLKLSLPSGSFEISLNDQGLMDSMTKMEGGKPIYQVSILSWYNAESVLLPAKIQIIDARSKNKLVLVFTDIIPSGTVLPQLNFTPPENMEPMSGS